jgi:hypothetical protein
MGLTDFKFKFPKEPQQPAKSEGTTTARRSSLAIEQAPSSPYGSSFRTVEQRRPRHEFKSFRLKGEYVAILVHSFYSTTLTRSSYVQPWAGDKRMKRTKYNNYIIYIFIFLSLALCAYLTYDGVKSAKVGDVSLIRLLLIMSNFI